MNDQKAESLQSESGTPADLWDFISNETGIPCDVCKAIIGRMLFGIDLIKYAIKHGLRINEMGGIRRAFDQYTNEHKEQQCRTSN